MTAGSHLHGYATRLPALNLLFPTRTLKAASRRLLDEQGVDHRAFLRELPSDKLWNINGLTVRGFERLVSRSGFETEQIRYLGHMDHRLADHRGRAAAVRRPVYSLFELLARAPWVREAFCMRVCAILRRAARDGSEL